jgi:hypothetical protein
MRGLLGYPWLLLKLYWPWLPLMVAGLIIQVRQMARNRERLGELLVVWVAFVIFPFSLAEAKVLRYIMPAFPAFSMLSAIPLAKWLSLVRKDIHLRMGYLALSMVVILIAAFPRPLIRAEDMRRLAPIVDAYTDPQQRVTMYDRGEATAQHFISQLLWYSNRFCTYVKDPDDLVAALRADKSGVFIVDTGSYERLAIDSGVKVEMLGQTKNFVCFRIVDDISCDKL